MSKNLAVFGMALAATMLGAHAAFAGGNDFLCLLFHIGCPSGPPGGGNPAPAPLLAAGIPAFGALGGGVFFTRLYRKFKRRA